MSTAPGRTVEEDGQVHRDSVNDTHKTHMQFKGWVLSCLWCNYKAHGRGKDVALRLMQEHYDQFGIEVHS